MLVVLVAAAAAILVAYRPSLSPPGLHPRDVEFAAAKAEILVDTQDSALVDRTQTFAGPVQLTTTYALYLQSDAVRGALGTAVGLHGKAVVASGPFTLLLGRTNFARGPNLPPFPTDKRYRLLVDVDGARPMITLYAQAPTTGAAVALVDAARRVLEQHVREQQRSYPLAAPERAMLRELGPTMGAAVDPHATPELIGFVFVFVLLTGGVVLEGIGGRRRRRRTPARPESELGLEDPADGATGDLWPHTSRLLPWALAAFVAMIFLVPFDSAQLPLIHLPLNSNMDRPVLVALVMLWLAGVAFGSGAARPQIRLTPIHVALLLFFVACCASLVFNGDALITMGDLTLSLKKLALLLSYIVFFIVVASVVRPAEVPRFASLIIVLGVIVAVATVVEARFHFNPFYELWKHVLSVAVPADLDKRDSIGRLTVYGPTGQPLELAALLAMVTPFALVRLIESKSSRRRALYVLAVGALLAGGLATSRKTSVVAPAAGVLMLMAYRPRVMIRWTLRLSIPLFLVIHLTSPGSLGSVVSQLEPGHLNGVLTTRDRTARYDAVRPDVMTHALIGRGYQSYDPHKYRILDNQFLQVVIGVGLIGLALYAVIFLTMLRTAHPTIRGPDRQRAALALAGAASIVVIIVANALFDVMSFPHVPYLLFFVAGMVVALGQRDRRLDAVKRVQRPAPVGRVDELRSHSARARSRTSAGVGAGAWAPPARSPDRVRVSRQAAPSTAPGRPAAGHPYRQRKRTLEPVLSLPLTGLLSVIVITVGRRALSGGRSRRRN